jgi:nitrous oxidase accessory protein NosD
VIEDIRADQNTYMGMLITGNGDMIRNNLIITTGGSTTLGANANANGIYVLGSGAQVLNNTVTGVSAQASGNTTGVYLDSASNSVVADNRIGNLTSPNGSSYGVFLNSGSDLIVSDNRLTGMQYGIYFANATGKFFSNVAQGVSTPYTGGIAAGITNY